MQQKQLARVVVPTVLSEVNHGAIAPQVASFHDDIAEQDGMTARPGGVVTAIDQIKLTVGRIVHEAGFDPGHVRAALDVMACRAIVDLTAAHDDTRSAQVQVVTVARPGRTAVSKNSAPLDEQSHGAVQRSRATGHDAHIVVVNRAVPDDNPTGIMDAHTCPVVAPVPCTVQLEPLQHTAVGTAVELENRPGNRPDTAVLEPGPVDAHSVLSRRVHGAEGDAWFPDVERDSSVRLTIRQRVHENDVAGARSIVRRFDLLVAPAGPDLKCRAKQLHRDRRQQAENRTCVFEHGIVL